MKTLGIDIGGSAIKGAPVDTTTGELLEERYRVPTPAPVSPDEMAKIVADIVAKFKWRGTVGVGFPGVIQGSVARTSANLDKRFIDCDLAKLFGKSVKCRIKAVNDADAAGLAEMRFGAGRGHDGTVLLLTLGTGVGSALFRQGMLFPNTELGHLPLRGRSAEKYMSAAVRKNLDLTWEDWAVRLDEYLKILETILWPDLFILGGGVSAKSEKFFCHLKRRTVIVPAKLMNSAGIVGAALAADSR